METTARAYEAYYVELLKQLPELIPGISKALLFFGAMDTAQGLRSLRYSYQKGQYGSQSLDASGVVSKIEELRQGSLPFDWMKEEDVPFSEKPIKTGQIDIFSELNKEILLLRLPPRAFSTKDILFIHLSTVSDDPAIKGIRKGIDNASRSFIGLMCWKTIRHILDRIDSQEDKLQGFMRQTRESYRLFNKERENYRKTGERYGESLLKLAEAHLRELGYERKINFRLSETASETIRKYPGDLTNLLSSLLHATEYAEELYSGSQLNEILIEDWFLELFSKTDKRVDEKIKEAPEQKGALSKTSELLDKLEDAARKVNSNSLKLTSANVGRMCPAPISAPAITDSIRNHRNRIIQLFDRHPEKWMLIRNSFRPIINVLESNDDDSKRESA